MTVDERSATAAPRGAGAGRRLLIWLRAFAVALGTDDDDYRDGRMLALEHELRHLRGIVDDGHVIHPSDSTPDA